MSSQKRGGGKGGRGGNSGKGDAAAAARFAAVAASQNMTNSEWRRDVVHINLRSETMDGFLSRDQDVERLSERMQQLRVFACCLQETGRCDDADLDCAHGSKLILARPVDSTTATALSKQAALSAAQLRCGVVLAVATAQADTANSQDERLSAQAEAANLRTIQRLFICALRVAVATRALGALNRHKEKVARTQGVGIFLDSSA